MKKRVLLFVGICLVISALQVSVFATSDFTPIWPLDGCRYVNSLDHYPDGDSHRGIDISTEKLTGKEVKAVASGVVTEVENPCNHFNISNDRCGSINGLGNFITIMHEVNGAIYYSRYAHLTQNSNRVNVGDSVSQGQVIALSGSSGASYAPHLHLEIHTGDRYTNAPKSLQYYIDNNLGALDGISFYEPLIRTSRYFGQWIKDNCTAGVYSPSYYTYRYTQGNNTPIPVPSAPANLVATWSETRWAANLSWTPSNNATSYEVQYTTPKTGGWKADSDYAGGTSYVTTGLKDYSSYSFRVRAVNSGAYSSWTELTFYKTISISLNANGGNVSPSSISRTYDSDAGIPSTYSGLPIPTRDGYSFDGWYTAASGGSRVTDSTKVVETQSQTIYAHWTKSDVAVTGVALTQNTLTLEIGDNATLIATVNPSNATDKSVTWSSSNPSVATVSNGKVTAVGTGSATITAAAGGKSASCAVTVSAANVVVTGVTLSQTSLALNPGGSATLTATVSPSNATDKSVTWSSSNPSVATVSNGKVTAVGAGSATITATAGSKSVSCAVTVSRAKCVITYGANGGSGIMQETKVDSGTTIKLPNNGFTAPSGKQFKCWRIGVSNFPAGTEYTVNSDLLILAIWEDVYVAPSVSARLSIEGKSVSSGSDVTVPVKLEENPGLIGFNLHIDYDRNKLELVDIKPAAAFSDLMSNSNDPIRVLWVSGAGEAVKGNVTVFEMAFRAKSGATGQAQIRITAVEAESDVGSVTLGDAVGTISIVEPARVNRGDVNGDGKISLSDAVMLKRYLVGVDVKIDMTNSDVNGDGKVSLADIVMLQKHLIGIISIGN